MATEHFPSALPPGCTPVALGRPLKSPAHDGNLRSVNQPFGVRPVAPSQIPSKGLTVQCGPSMERGRYNMRPQNTSTPLLTHNAEKAELAISEGKHLH